MSELTIFNDITTESALLALEAESEKYTGLYVDMNEAEGRKYVKGQADEINSILKKLDRARIDKAKSYKASVEAEAGVIRARLEKANEPFTLLIDEHKAERKKILDAKKAKEEAEEAAKQLEIDHEFAILINQQWDNDKEKREAERAAEVEAIAEQARQDLIAKQEKEAAMQKALDEARARDAAKAEQDRLNNLDNQRKVNNEVLADLTEYGLTDEQATLIIKAVFNGRIRNLQINY